MPTLVLENVPNELYERLEMRAAARRRSLCEETLDLLQQGLQVDVAPKPRFPDFIDSEAIPAPCDLPRSSHPVSVVAYAGERRLPDVRPEWMEE